MHNPRERNANYKKARITITISIGWLISYTLVNDISIAEILQDVAPNDICHCPKN